MSIHKISLLILFCTLAACDPGSQRRLDRETMEREQRLREPRIIKEGQIVEKAMEQGALMVKLLRENMPVADSSQCCPVSGALVDSLQRQYTVTINCYSLNSAFTVKQAVEREVMDAYLYASEKNLPLETNIQPIGKEQFLYTTPTQANGEATKSKCGVWSILLSRKQVVLSIE